MTTAKKESVRRFDAAEFLTTNQDFDVLMQDAVESGDPRVMIAALSTIARSRGMTALAEKTGITREGLYKSLSSAGNPSFANVASIAGAMGYKITIVPERAKPAEKSATKKVASPRARTSDAHA